MPPDAAPVMVTAVSVNTVSALKVELFTSGALTVTVQNAVFPLDDVAVIFAVPGATAVTLPPLTVATELLLVLQYTVLLVASEGLMVAVRVEVSPVVRLSEVLSRVTPVTAITGSVTVTVQFASLPFTDAAVMVAVPGATAVTLPPLTVATELLLVLQVTVLLEASDGSTVAVRVAVLPVVSFSAL